MLRQKNYFAHSAQNKLKYFVLCQITMTSEWDISLMLRDHPRASLCIFIHQSPWFKPFLHSAQYGQRKGFLHANMDSHHEVTSHHRVLSSQTSPKPSPPWVDKIREPEPWCSFHHPKQHIFSRSSHFPTTSLLNQHLSSMVVTGFINHISTAMSALGHIICFIVRTCARRIRQQQQQRHARHARVLLAQLGGPVATADLFAYQILCTKWRMYNYA